MLTARVWDFAGRCKQFVAPWTTLMSGRAGVSDGSMAARQPLTPSRMRLRQLAG